MPSARGREKNAHTKRSPGERCLVRGACGGLGGCGPPLPRCPLHSHERTLPGQFGTRVGLIFYPRAKASSFLGAVSLPLPILPLCSSPLPPVLGLRPLGVPTSPPPPPPRFFRRGGRVPVRGSGKTWRRGWGWGRRHRELFTRKSQGYVFEPPRPRPGCIVLARAPGARGGPSEVRWPGRRRAALCSSCAPPAPPGPLARAPPLRGDFSHPVPAPLALLCRLRSSGSQRAERAGDSGWGSWGRAVRKK